MTRLITVRKEFIFCAALILASLFIAHWRYFIQDDAFISFRYAKHFAEGHGLVWEIGSDEFGYTNFLYTLLIGILMWLGFDHEFAAAFISIPSYLICLLLTFRLCKQLSPNSSACYLASIFTAANYSFSSYASGGLETSFNTVLILATYCNAFELKDTKRIPPTLWKIALFTSLSLLCRLDSALILAPVYAYAGYVLLRNKITSPKNFSLLSLPLLVLGLFLYGCYSFYGYALPNTFYAKLQLHRDFFYEGKEYIGNFIRSEFYTPSVLLAWAIIIPCIRNDWKKLISAEILVLLSALFIWLGYIVKIGGDFMEFRMLVPVIPLFYTACFTLITNSFQPHNLLAIVAACLLSIPLSMYHQNNFHLTSLMGNIKILNLQVAGPDDNWQTVGKKFGELFYTGSPDDVTLASHTTGAIPYYSQLKTVDIYGLNTRWVAINGEPASRIPGHRKRAPFWYLIAQNVHIVLPGLPIFLCENKDLKNPPGYMHLPALLIPLDKGCYVVGYYLTEHPKIEELIQQNKITKVMPIEN